MRSLTTCDLTSHDYLEHRRTFPTSAPTLAMIRPVWAYRSSPGRYATFTPTHREPSTGSDHYSAAVCRRCATADLPTTRGQPAAEGDQTARREGATIPPRQPRPTTRRPAMARGAEPRMSHAARGSEMDNPLPEFPSAPLTGLVRNPGHPRR